MPSSQDFIGYGRPQIESFSLSLDGLTGHPVVPTGMSLDFSIDVYPDHNIGIARIPLVQARIDAMYRDWETDRKSTRLNSSHSAKSRMPSSA